MKKKKHGALGAASVHNAPRMTGPHGFTTHVARATFGNQRSHGWIWVAVTPPVFARRRRVDPESGPHWLCTGQKKPPRSRYSIVVRIRDKREKKSNTNALTPILSSLRLVGWSPYPALGDPQNIAHKDDQ
ncbi:hypothetical protein MRX96_044247 [Rhipicephalus microplus]